MSDLLQITRGTSATVRETFYLDGAPSDLDGGPGAVPVVTITRPDGTTIASGTVTRISTGLFSFVLAAQAQCTLLTVSWVGTIGGQVQTLTSRVEVLGGLLFTIPAFRAMKVAGGTPFALTATPLYSDAQIMGTRAAILDELCQILGFSPVPRFARATLNGNGMSELMLPGLEASLILSVTINGVAQTATDYQVGPGNTIEAVANYTSGTPFARGRRNVVVEWVHGLERIPGKGSHVAMLWAAAQLNPSGFSSASTVSMPDGSTYTYEPSETGRGGFRRHTGNRELDRWLNRWAPGWAVA